MHGQRSHVQKAHLTHTGQHGKLWKAQAGSDCLGWHPSSTTGCTLPGKLQDLFPSVFFSRYF